MEPPDRGDPSRKETFDLFLIWSMGSCMIFKYYLFHLHQFVSVSFENTVIANRAGELRLISSPEAMQRSDSSLERNRLLFHPLLRNVQPFSWLRNHYSDISKPARPDVETSSEINSARPRVKASSETSPVLIRIYNRRWSKRSFDSGQRKIDQETRNRVLIVSPTKQR
jgi:hypothetical protein